MNNKKNKVYSFAKGYQKENNFIELATYKSSWPPMVVWLRFRPVDRRVAGLIPDSTNFLANSSGQAMYYAPVSLFIKQ